MPHPLRVLVIDDVPAMRESLRIALRGVGYDTTVAPGGREALDLLAEKPFDVVVTDIWMPGIDGITLIKRLRSERPSLRVFAMTGGGPRLTIETAASLAEIWGAERIFVKPFDEEALIAAIAGCRDGP